jgi:DNA polymerase delta subunit 3
MSKLSDSEDDETASTRVKPPSTSKRTETKSTARVRRAVLISDDDDDEEAPPPPPPRAKAAYKAKAKAKEASPPNDPEAEKELRAMMDIDDGKKEKFIPFSFLLVDVFVFLDQVTKVSRTASVSEPATSPPATDVEMEGRDPEPDPEPEPEPERAPTRKKPQRKPKKEVPVGRNGLKKRRVVKSRMTTDEKGYFGAIHITFPRFAC